MGEHDGRSTRFARIPLWVLLAVVVTVPLTGVVGIAAQEVTTRWDHREASRAQEQAARDLGEVVAVRAALAEEETYSTIVVLARQLDIDLTGLGPDGSYEQALATARSRLDTALERRPVPGLDAGAAILQDVRGAVDHATAQVSEVDEAFTEMETVVDTEIAASDRRVEVAANQRPMGQSARARLRALRDTVEGVTHSSARIGHAMAILGAPTPTTAANELEGLVRETTRALDAFDRAAAGFGPRARRAWEAHRENPSTARLEAVMTSAIEVGQGAADSPVSGPEAVVTILADGLVWATTTIDVLQAVAADLEESAAAAAAADSRTVTRWIVVASAVVVVAMATAIMVGRSLRRAAEELEGAAREIQQGRFELPPLVPDGSRELAAAVSAFNDMAATLEAVERHAVALAEAPSSPVLSEPLPGRTGEALQEALDALQSSIRQAEQRSLELKHLASHDALTGLLNRRAAFEALDRDLARARRDGSVLMVLYVDLDGLKAVNDTYGHSVGDVAIHTTAQVLTDATRQGDVVARLGGDEFLVVGMVPAGGRGEAQVQALADRLLSAVNDASVAVADGIELPLRASIGVAVSNPSDESVEDLVRRADAALYVAKQAGRHQVAWPGR